jgi:membrane protein DedA with SNARE-associated domain
MSSSDADGLTGWVVDVIEKIDEVGIGALIALENVFPPIPSEAILPFAGFSAAQGDVNVVLAWVAATLGALVGAYILYGVGAVIGYDRLQLLAAKRWFILFGEADLARGERFFEQHGAQIILFGRFIPLVRSIVSVPAGWSRMPLPRFTVFTLIGSAIWNAVFIAIGYELGHRWDRVEAWVEPLGYAVLAVLLAALVWVAVRKLRSTRSGEQQPREPAVGP